jgi:predicted phosphate transport protein (TIGR00153 family)
MKMFPKEVHFSDNFEELADKIQEGAMLFLEILNDFKGSKDRISTLKEIEHEADTITHRIYQDLHKTFITPLDREDIYSLANKMDSIVDMIDEAASKMQLYRLKEPLPDHKLLAAILNKATVLLNKSIHAMRNRRANINIILEYCIEINSLENEADNILRNSMAQLFEREKDAIELIKCKEILERIEETTDICEDVSNIIEGIILKYG